MWDGSQHTHICMMYTTHLFIGKSCRSRSRASVKTSVICSSYFFQSEMEQSKNQGTSDGVLNSNQNNSTQAPHGDSSEVDLDLDGAVDGNHVKMASGDSTQEPPVRQNGATSQHKSTPPDVCPEEAPTPEGAVVTSSNPQDGGSKENLAPDGGYGWVIMMASFFNSVIIDGVCFR